MGFTKLRLVGRESLDLPVVGAQPSDPFICKAVDGLDPPDQDVFMSNTLYQGGIYQNSKAQLREIVIRVGLNPNYAASEEPSDLRKTLYAYLYQGPGKLIELHVMNGSTVLGTVTGKIKRMNSALFSRTNEIYITLACTQSYFLDPVTTNRSGMSKFVPNLPYTGDYESGFAMAITFTSAMSSWSITELTGEHKMVFNHSFLSGDTLAFNTQPGDRGIWLTRSSVTTSLLKSMSSDSTWLTLLNGNNLYSLSSNLFNWGQVNYRSKYWGF